MEKTVKVSKGEETNHLRILTEVMNDCKSMFEQVPHEGSAEKMFGITKTVAKQSFIISCKIEVLKD